MCRCYVHICVYMCMMCDYVQMLCACDVHVLFVCITNSYVRILCADCVHSVHICALCAVMCRCYVHMMCTCNMCVLCTVMCRCYVQIVRMHALFMAFIFENKIHEYVMYSQRDAHSRWLCAKSHILSMRSCVGFVRSHTYVNKKKLNLFYAHTHIYT